MEKTNFHTKFVKKKSLILLAMVLLLPVGSFAQVFTNQTTPLGFSTSPATATAISSSIAPSAPQSAFNPFQSTESKLINTSGEGSSFPSLRGHWDNWVWVGNHEGDKWDKDGHEYVWWLDSNKPNGGYWYWVGFAPISDDLTFIMILCGLYVGIVAYRRRKSRKVANQQTAPSAVA